jgi:hypothetical protein
VGLNLSITLLGVITKLLIFNRLTSPAFNCHVHIVIVVITKRIKGTREKRGLLSKSLIIIYIQKIIMAYLYASIFLLFIAGSIIVTSMLIITIPLIYAQQKDPSCQNLYSGPNLWDHTYNHARFKTHSPDCITVTGKVLSATLPGGPGRRT